MKSKAFIFLLFLATACGQAQKELTPVELAISNLEKRLGAEKSVLAEADETYKGQGTKRVLSVQFYGCKGVDLMDSSIKPHLKVLAQQLKNSVQGSERIEKYKFVLHKDPNDKTPSKSGFNIAEKGFNFDREDLD